MKGSPPIFSVVAGLAVLSASVAYHRAEIAADFPIFVTEAQIHEALEAAFPPLIVGLL